MASGGPAERGSHPHLVAAASRKKPPNKVAFFLCGYPSSMLADDAHPRHLSIGHHGVAQLAIFRIDLYPEPPQWGGVSRNHRWASTHTQPCYVASGNAVYMCH